MMSIGALLLVTKISVFGIGGLTPTSWHGHSHLQAVSLEVAGPLGPRTDLALVVSPMNLWQPRSWFGDDFGDGNENVRALSVSVLLRRRFNLESSRVHYYLEGASGPMWAEKAVPASTSRFNFASHAGAGVIFNPDSRYPIIAGYRFMHVSNGGYSPRNPGLNFSTLVLGVQVRR